jgi:methylated-DNA-[protein]-cysteine S-methyltransferase
MKAFLRSPVGVIKITEIDGYISAVSFVDDDDAGQSDSSELLNEATKQLREYFDGKRRNFNLPLNQTGTDFQQKAWGFLTTIPYGQTVSYKNEAIAIGSPKGYRAVGSANGKNNLAIIVPCHRVVNEDNGLGGYAYGLDIKRHLLELEKYYK